MPKPKNLPGYFVTLIVISFIGTIILTITGIIPDTYLVAEGERFIEFSQLTCTLTTGNNRTYAVNNTAQFAIHYSSIPNPTRYADYALPPLTKMESYRIEWGDGTSSTGTDQLLEPIEHIYTEPGVYQAIAYATFYHTQTEERYEKKCGPESYSRLTITE